MGRMEELKEMLCDELEEIQNKGNLSAGDLETVHKLTDTIKNIYKIESLKASGYSNTYRGDNYSRDGGWRAEGGYSRDYRNGNSYGRHWVRGHYSMDGAERMEEKIQEIMDDPATSGSDRAALRKAMDILNK